jgi:hypothetical protein
MKLEEVKMLKMSLEKQFGKPIKKEQDLHFLKQDIKDTIDIEIGINTLRRFFGFMPFKFPRDTTIEKLVHYLGFKNSSVFLNNTNTNKSWDYWFRNNTILLSGIITQKDLEWLIASKNREDYFIYLSSILKEFLSKKNINGLLQLFSNDELFLITDSDAIKIAAIVGQRLRTYSESEFKLLEPLVGSTNFRRNILYLNVDYAHLNGYYGYLIDYSKTIIQNDDEKLFTNLVLNYHLYLSGKNSYLNLLHEKIPKNCHPVLYGRYWAYQLLYFEKTNFDEIYQEMMRKSHKIESKIEFFHEIIPALILLNKINLVKAILVLHFEALFSITSWNQEYLKAGYIIGQAFVLLKEKKYKLAAVGLGYVDFSKIYFKQDYLKLFYLVCQYNINKQTHLASQEALKQEYLHLVEKSGFYFFTETFLENYMETNPVQPTN